MSPVISRAQDVGKHHMIIPVGGLGESSHSCIIILLNILASSTQDIPLLSIEEIIS